jgi:hypothetical protein
MGDKKDYVYALAGQGLPDLVYGWELLDLTESTYIGIFPTLCNQQKYFHNGDEP